MKQKQWTYLLGNIGGFALLSFFLYVVLFNFTIRAGFSEKYTYVIELANESDASTNIAFEEEIHQDSFHFFDFKRIVYFTIIEKKCFYSFTYSNLFHPEVIAPPPEIFI